MWTEKTVASADVLQLTQLVLNLFKHARTVIQKKWQQRSLGTQNKTKQNKNKIYLLLYLLL